MVSNIKDFEIYRLSLELSDIVYSIVSQWDHLGKRTVGEQLIRSADSIGANLAEGFGRFHYKENRLFCFYARGSLEETKHWLRLAHKRQLIEKNQLLLIEPILEKLPPKLNAYIKSIGKNSQKSDDLASSE